MVDLVKKNVNAVTLAIGDGANDVAMIQVNCFLKFFLTLSLLSIFLYIVPPVPGFFLIKMDKHQKFLLHV